MVGVLIGAGNVIRECAGGGWKERRRGPGFLPLGAGRNWVRPVPSERRRMGGEAMRAALLLVLDAGKSLRKEEAVARAAVRHFCRWKGCLEREGREGRSKEKRSTGRDSCER